VSDLERGRLRLPVTECRSSRHRSARQPLSGASSSKSSSESPCYQWVSRPPSAPSDFRNRTGIAALHSAVSAGHGAFGLAVRAKLHSVFSGPADAHRRNLVLLSLVLWPVPGVCSGVRDQYGAGTRQAVAVKGSGRMSGLLRGSVGSGLGGRFRLVVLHMDSGNAERGVLQGIETEHQVLSEVVLQYYLRYSPVHECRAFRVGCPVFTIAAAVKELRRAKPTATHNTARYAVTNARSMACRPLASAVSAAASRERWA